MNYRMCAEADPDVVYDNQVSGGRRRKSQDENTIWYEKLRLTLCDWGHLVFS